MTSIQRERNRSFKQLQRSTNELLSLTNMKRELSHTKMSTTVLPQLEEIASELAAQEESLIAQLRAVQDKLSGIRAVLPMFDNNSSSVATTSSATAEEEAAVDLPKNDSTDNDSDVPALSEKKIKASGKKTTTKAKKAKKKDGRAADWQKYTRPGVKNQSIPDAVKLVLATQPEKDFKIAEVMEALFKEGMPKAQYLKARNRVSNVLSGGVRAGDWQRGERSTYRMGAA